MLKLALSALIIFTHLSCFAGNSFGNGGDITSLEFVRYARLAIKYLNESKVPTDLEPTVKKIENSLEVVKVNSSSELLMLNGNEVDAINYPLESKIVVSRNGWKYIKQYSLFSLYTFVLHEYLGVSGINDQEYSTSQKLLKVIDSKIRKNYSSEGLLIENLASLEIAISELKNLFYSKNAEPITSREMPWIQFCSKSSTALVYANNIDKLFQDNPDLLQTYEAQKQGYTRLYLAYSDRINQLCNIDQNQFEYVREQNMLNEFYYSIKYLIDINNFLNFNTP
jgi:hypothetical protein